MTIRALVLSSLVALAACGGLLPEDPADGPDAGTPGETESCTELVNGGEEIPETAGVVFFGPGGGTVADGTYHLTKFQIFSPGTVDPYVRRHTLRVTGTRVEVVTQKDGGPEERMTATMTTSGTNVTFAIDCPEAAEQSFGYTASETQFIHVIEGPGIKEVHTYTKQ